jgi:hypothetical protein
MALGFKNELLIQEYEFDVAKNGGATGTYRLDQFANKAALPVGCVRKNVHIVVQDALLGSSASAALGTVASSALFKANAAIASWGAGLFNYGDVAQAQLVDAANKGQVLFTVAGGALTAGKFKVLVEYVVPNA